MNFYFFGQNIATKSSNFPVNDVVNVVLASKLRGHDVVLVFTKEPSLRSGPLKYRSPSRQRNLRL